VTGVRQPVEAVGPAAGGTPRRGPGVGPATFLRSVPG